MEAAVAAFKQELPTFAELDQRLKVERELGRGAFGVTQLVRDTRTGLNMAMKQAVYQPGAEREWLVADYLHRVIAPEYRSHIPEVYAHYEYQRDGQRYVIILQQLVPGQSLQKFIQTTSRPADLELVYPKAKVLYTRSQPLRFCPDTAIRDISQQLYKVVRAIHAHARGIAHNDLTLNNILWDGRQIYLVDLGISCILNPRSAASCFQDRMITNIQYVHPQFYGLLKAHRVPSAQQFLANDLWQAGLTMYNLILGTPRPEDLVTPAGRDWEDRVAVFKKEAYHRQKGTLRVSKLLAKLEIQALKYLRPLV